VSTDKERKTLKMSTLSLVAPAGMDGVYVEDVFSALTALRFANCVMSGVFAPGYNAHCKGCDVCFLICVCFSARCEGSVSGIPEY
jgi:hypothetical protein